MARLYEASDDRGCPGEENCETWQSSAPNAPVRCPDCPNRTAAKKGREGDAESGGESVRERELLDRVEQLRRQRDSGRTGIYQTVTPKEWKVLQIFDNYHEAHRIAHEHRIAGMFAFMMAMLVGR